MSANAEAKVTLSLIDRVTGPIKRISARLGALSKRIGFDRVGAAIGNLGTRIKGLGDGLAQTSGRLAGFLGLLGVGGAGAISAAYGLAKSASDVGSEIHDMSVKLGIGAEALTEWRHVADQAGIEVATFDKGVEKLGINAVEASKGNKQMAAAFKALGVNVKGAKGQMRPMEEILDDTMLALSRIKDPLKRNQLAFKLFGKSGVELTKILADGADGIKAGREEARRLGTVWSQDAANAADAFGDGVNALSKRLSAFKTFVGVQLLPVINDAIEGINRWLDANSGLIRSTITDWVQKLGGFIRDLIDPASQVRVKFDEFASAVSSTYDKVKPFFDFIGGPFAAAMALIGVWALAPAILATTMLAGAFLKLSATIVGFSAKTLFSIGDAIADFAGKGLAEKVGVAGTTAGGFYGKAFALAARVAIIAGVAAAAAEALQAVDPKGNLWGATSGVDNWFRRITGQKESDTGLMPGELFQGLKNLLPSLGSDDEGQKHGVLSKPSERLSPVALDLGFDKSPVFGGTGDRVAAAAKSRAYGLGSTTDTAPGKAKDDAATAAPTILTQDSNNTTTVNLNASVTVNATTNADPAAIGAAVRRELDGVAKRVAANVNSSLSD